MLNIDLLPSVSRLLPVLNPEMNISGPVDWILHEGMLFKDEVAWWNPGQTRPNRHEGIDLLYFNDASGRAHHLEPTINLPLPLTGTIVAITKDFLGKSIWIRHDDSRRPLGFSRTGEDNPPRESGLPGQHPDVLYTVYAHVLPATDLRPGMFVEVGQRLGGVARQDPHTSKVPAHLHLSALFAPPRLAVSCFHWPTLWRNSAIELLNPLAAIHAGSK